MWLACSRFLPCTLAGRERRFSETQARLLRRQFTALDRSEQEATNAHSGRGLQPLRVKHAGRSRDCRKFGGGVLGRL